MPHATPRAVRHRLAVTGIVQGVGFRPFVHGLARRHGLGGFVRNVPGGVEIEVQGLEDEIEAFEHELVAEAPPLAHLEEVVACTAPLGPARGFEIEATSRAGAAEPTPVPPDVATCAECLRELFDPADRRHRYPFLNCTHCGPRFTLIEDVPYDRAATTMRSFTLCPACAAEYHDPANRRFHAQPTACPACGPRLEWVGPGGGEPLAAALATLAAGAVVAIKGLGGFHLACDARSEAAATRLRERKGRGDKPFAVMVASLDEARRYAVVSPVEARLLESRARPIVLLAARRGSELAPAVAPGAGTIGLLLPYTPLHALLFEGDLAGRPLVMTSGNRSEEPIARENGEARERLAGLADGFLLHDREIHVTCDDSVMRVFAERGLPLRRSRGYAPFPLRLPVPAGEPEPPDVLAVGGELKATFCLTRGRRAFLSQHLGDQDHLLTQQAFERALDHAVRLFRGAPKAVVADLHPDYRSGRLAARWAAERGLPLLRVQHHHAHVAALLAEHGLAEAVLGVAFDGAGHGPDGTVWGGELLVADYRGFTRLAHLRRTRQPGGDAAVRKPGRMAFAHLHAAGLPLAAAGLDDSTRRVLERQLATGVGAPWTSSMGRLFDAVAALVGLGGEVSFEGQAAMALEAAATTPEDGSYDFELVADGQNRVLEPAPVLAAILEDLARGVSSGVISARFHAAVASAVVALARFGRERAGLERVALTGGVFQNVRLLGEAVAGLRAAGFEPLVHREVPPNDGGLALGQAAIVALGGGREAGLQ